MACTNIVKDKHTSPVGFPQNISAHWLFGPAVWQALAKIYALTFIFKDSATLKNIVIYFRLILNKFVDGNRWPIFSSVNLKVKNIINICNIFNFVIYI